MLPNHSPLVIAEQFGTLAALHPDRIDLGLGRAPGTDQVTVRALRRDPRAAESFPQDVVELQGFLGDETVVPGVNATPGRGTHVPITILGSSLFGAQLAAMLGRGRDRNRPEFAWHIAPDATRLRICSTLCGAARKSSRRCISVTRFAIGCKFSVQSSAESPPPTIRMLRPRNCSILRTA